MAIQALLILAALALLWLKPILTSATMQPTSGDGILYRLLLSWLGDHSGWAITLTMILVLSEGLVLNILLTSVGLVSQTSLLPTMLYILATSANGIPLTPILLVNAVLIAFVGSLMLHGSSLSVSTSKISLATAMLALCTMIYTPSIMFLATYLLVVINYRLYSWRDWLALILGFAAPNIVLVVCLYLCHNLSGWWADLYSSGITFGFNLDHMSITSIIANIFIALVMVIALIAQLSSQNERTIKWQKNASTVILLYVGGIAMLTCEFPLTTATAAFAIPFALCGNTLLLPTNTGHTHTTTRKKSGIKEILFLLLILACLIC